jgi:tetratricopeptide (TPR) repeat protein
MSESSPSPPPPPSRVSTSACKTRPRRRARAGGVALTLCSLFVKERLVCTFTVDRGVRLGSLRPAGVDGERSRSAMVWKRQLVTQEVEEDAWGIDSSDSLLFKNRDEDDSSFPVLQAADGHLQVLNRTALSLKVEAELLRNYDETVPGPGIDGTVRPLTINLDLLSYHARQAILKGDRDEGIRLYKRCIELDPRDGRGWMGLARDAQKGALYRKARALFETGLSHSPDNPFLLQAYGVLEEKEGNKARALELYMVATRVCPNHAASWVALGRLYQQSGRYAKAKECFSMATKADPQSYYALQVWGMLEVELGDYDAARKRFTQCVRVNPRNAAVYQAWGVLEAREGNLELAAQLFERGYASDKRNTFVLQAWALMEWRRGRSEVANQLFEKALATRPKDAAVWQAYGLMKKTDGDVATARKLLQEATRANPRHSPSWQALGMLEAELGRPEVAREIFQQGIWACPRGEHTVRILQSWAILEAGQGRYEESRKMFKNALTLDPRSVPVIVAWALMEASQFNGKRARSLFEVALKLQQGRRGGNQNLWIAYEAMERRLGEGERADAVRERSELQPLDSQASLANARAAAGEVLEKFVDGARAGSLAELEMEYNNAFGYLKWTPDYMDFCASPVPVRYST